MTTAYTSLLGLALPVTGELSGTWGDTVNNSITSLLDSAIAGTTTISSDADVTLTTTTGAANTSREAILLWTAGGTVTRNITAPAQSKTYIVINASSSTQSIVLRGVGPTTGVTIIKGESAVCAWNGSDFIKVSNISGAGVFSSITNTGLTTGRVVYTTTGGLETSSANLLYSGTDLTVYGLTVGRGAGALYNNTVVGATALASGSQAGGSIVAVGYNTLQNNTTASYNTGVGYYALNLTTTGGNNTAIGANSLASNTTGAQNTAVGMQALYSNTTVNSNTAMGYQAAYATTTGTQNTAVGNSAMSGNTTGGNNVAVGHNAMTGANTGNNNTAIGVIALQQNTSGANNTALGVSSLGVNTTGGSNTAIGANALNANTTANNNTAVGVNALNKNTTGTSNSAFGTNSMLNTTTGTQNTALGMEALISNTTASNNTAVGYQAAYSNTTGATLTAVGFAALYANTTGTSLTAVGDRALTANTTGQNSTAVGTVALQANTTGANNSALGYAALNSNTTGNQNIGIGTSALQVNSTGSNNTSVGHAALQNNTTASSNTAVGYQAGYSQTTSVVGNTYFGIQAGYGVTTGYANLFVGRLSGYGITTGYNNVIIGSYQGATAPISATGSNYIVLSDGDGNVRQTIDSSGNVGIGTTSPAQKLDVYGNVNIPADSYYYLGGASDRYIRYRSSQNDVLYSGYSGLFYKQDVAGVYHAWFTGNNERMRIDSSGNVVVMNDLTGGTGAIFVGRQTTIANAKIEATGNDNILVTNQTDTGTGAKNILYILRNTNYVGGITCTNTTTSFPTSSDYRLKQDIAPMTGALDKVAALKPVTYKWKLDGSDGEGFIAHELAEVCPHAVTGEKDAVDEDGNPKYQGIDVSFLVATLAAAIQELKAEFDAYKATHP